MPLNGIIGSRSRDTLPDQKPIIISISNNNRRSVITNTYCNRPVHLIKTRSGIISIDVRLSQHQVGQDIFVIRKRRLDQNPVIVAIAHQQTGTIRRHSFRMIEEPLAAGLIESLTSAESYPRPTPS